MSLTKINGTDNNTVEIPNASGKYISNTDALLYEIWKKITTIAPGGDVTVNAHNGVNVDGGGFVSLGGNLLSDTEINMNGFDLNFVQALGSFTILADGTLELSADPASLIPALKINAASFNRDGLLVTYPGDPTNGLHLQYRTINFPSDGNSGISFPGGGNIVAQHANGLGVYTSPGNANFDNGIKSGNPNGAATAGVWKLGKYQAGTVQLVPTQYVLVNIDGVVVKLAVVEDTIE